MSCSATGWFRWRPPPSSPVVSTCVSKIRHECDKSAVGAEPSGKVGAATMPFWSRSGSQDQPRTNVGRWLRAMMLGQSQLREQLRPALNGGRRGWNDDEPAVAEAACELAAARFFGTDYDPRVISYFVGELGTATSNDPPLDPSETEAIIRSALGDKSARSEGITPARKFLTHNLVASFASMKLRLPEADVNQIIVGAEKMAFKRGWKPPLAG
jgi:hypothetical protein